MGTEKLILNGRVRIIMKPLMDELPIVGAIQVLQLSHNRAVRRRPSIRFLTAVHGDLLQRKDCCVVALQVACPVNHPVHLMHEGAAVSGRQVQVLDVGLEECKAAWCCTAGQHCSSLQGGATHSPQAAQGTSGANLDSVVVSPQAHAQVAFVEPPSFSLALTLYGGDISILPGLEAYLQNFVRDSILRCACHRCSQLSAAFRVSMTNFLTAWGPLGYLAEQAQQLLCLPAGLIGASTHRDASHLLHASNAHGIRRCCSQQTAHPRGVPCNAWPWLPVCPALLCAAS